MLKGFKEKKKEKQLNNAKIILEEDIVADLNSEEREKYEEICKKSKWANRLYLTFMGTSVVLAALNYQDVINGPIYDFSLSLNENFFNGYIELVEHFFKNTVDSLYRIATVVLPFAIGYKFTAIACYYDEKKKIIEDKIKAIKANRLAKKEEKKESLLSRCKEKQVQKAKDNLESSAPKLNEEELKALESKLYMKKAKRYKYLGYGLAGVAMISMAIFGHQVIDGAFFDSSMSIGENISNFVNTGSIYDSAYSFKDNLLFMLYRGIENFEMHKAQAIIGFATSLLSFSTSTALRTSAKAEKEYADELIGKEHKRDLVDKFFDKLIRRKKLNKAQEEAPEVVEPLDNCIKQA